MWKIFFSYLWYVYIKIESNHLFVKSFLFLNIPAFKPPCKGLESWVQGAKEGKREWRRLYQSCNLLEGISCDISLTALNWRRYLENICYYQHLNIVSYEPQVYINNHHFHPILDIEYSLLGNHRLSIWHTSL